MNIAQNTHLIKEEAYRLGFEFVGIARAEKMDEEARRLEQWLNKGMHGKMQYMENHFEKRIDPTKLVEGAKSVISVLLNYFPAEGHEQPADAPKISTYAWGKDYHKVIKNKLYRLLEFIQEKVGEVNAKGVNQV